MGSISPSEVVSTTYGPIQGFVKDGMKQFLGIPYAAPPVGDLRWRPPVPPAPWQKPLKALAFGNVCAQDAPCFPGFGHKSMDEDCLYLNVFGPVKADNTSKLPVMVLFPGGGLFCGGSSDYDPISLVSDGNVVFVSLNYRLGVFGFFSHPAINAEDHASGNYGIMDQQSALKWVRENIESFGGDPNNVTVMGESAGAISVMVHLASPASAGLFHKAIVQSGGSPATISQPTIETREKEGIALASAAGCDVQTPENLRSISTETIMACNAVPLGTFGVGPFTVGLMEDGIIVPRSMCEKFLDGQFNRVPLLTGVTHDEFSWFQGMMEFSTGHVISPEMHSQALALTLEGAAQICILGLQIPPSAIPAILERYPLSDYSSAGPAIASAVGDAGIISTAGRRTVRVIKQFVEDVYVYEFDVPGSPAAWPEVSFPYRSGHAQELQYLFPLFCGGTGQAHPLTEQQQQLAQKIVRCWTNFARNGTPNGRGPHIPELPRWEVYKAETDNIMLFSIPEAHMVNDWGGRHNSDFWDSFYM